MKNADLHSLAASLATGPRPSVYQLHGYANRREYLESLCAEYPRSFVFALAELYGPSEDFDGLITGLEDAADMGEF